MENLASTYRYEGRWTEAEDLYMQVMEIAKRMLGEAHPTTLKCINNLAVIYRDQGLWKEAEGLDAEAVLPVVRTVPVHCRDQCSPVRKIVALDWTGNLGCCTGLMQCGPVQC
jgi:hypothetical protein